MPDPLALASYRHRRSLPGIGPDITIRALLRLPAAMAAATGTTASHVLLKAMPVCWPNRAVALGVGHAWTRQIGEGGVVVEDMPLGVQSEPGKLDARNGRYVLALLDAAIDGLQAGKYAAMITAPVRARSTTRACRSPATPNTWPSAPPCRAW